MIVQCVKVVYLIYQLTTNTNTMTTFTNNETTYTTSKIIVKGNQYSVTVVKGLYNYINIKKITNNPFLTLGKEFANFNEATKAYKSPEMKTELLKIELGLI